MTDPLTEGQRSVEGEKQHAPGWLPRDWPCAAFDAMVAVVGQCPTGKCCTAETDGDACEDCTAVHVKIAEAFKPYIEEARSRSESRERELTDALRKARYPLAVAASYPPSTIGEKLWLKGVREALVEIDAALDPARLAPSEKA